MLNRKAPLLLVYPCFQPPGHTHSSTDRHNTHNKLYPGAWDGSVNKFWLHNHEGLSMNPRKTPKTIYKIVWSHTLGLTFTFAHTYVTYTNTQLKDTNSQACTFTFTHTLSLTSALELMHRGSHTLGHTHTFPSNTVTNAGSYSPTSTLIHTCPLTQMLKHTSHSPQLTYLGTPMNMPVPSTHIPVHTHAHSYSQTLLHLLSHTHTHTHTPLNVYMFTINTHFDTFTQKTHLTL